MPVEAMEAEAEAEAEDKDMKENYAKPYWTAANTMLVCVAKGLFEPMGTFCTCVGQAERCAVVLCACFWTWIPLCTVYLLIASMLFSIIATIVVIVGFGQSLVFLSIGVLPGILMAISITSIGLIRLPWNLYYHLAICFKDARQGLVLKALSLLLLVPVQLAVPVVAAVASLGPLLTSCALAMLGLPLRPWTSVLLVHQEAWRLMVTNVEGKFNKYGQEVEGPEEEPKEGERRENKDEKKKRKDNYGEMFWVPIQEIYIKLIPLMHSIPASICTKIWQTPSCSMAFGVIILFCPLWITFAAVYYLAYGLIVTLVTIALILLAFIQCIIYFCLGVWPGVILAIDITGISILRIPNNIVFQLRVIYKSIENGTVIKAINLFLLLPVHLLVPIILAIGSLVCGVLFAGTLALLGCPQIPWRNIKAAHEAAWTKMVVEVRSKVHTYCEPRPPAEATEEETPEPAAENYAVAYWLAVGEFLAQGWITTISVLSHTPHDCSLRLGLLTPLWVILVIGHLAITAAGFVVVGLPLVLIGFIQSLIFLFLGVWPGLIISLGVTGITIYRLPWNIYYHCLVTYRTVMLRRSLKMWSFIFVPPTHLLVPIVIGAISFGCSLPACAALAFVGWPQTPWAKIKPVMNKFWKRFVTDVKAHVDNYGDQSGIPLNWDGKIYGLGLDPFTIVMSILFYAYAVIPVSVGIIVLLIIKTGPIVLKTVASYCKCNDFGKAAVGWCEKIATFGQYNACATFGDVITQYFNLVKLLNPSHVGTAVSDYSKNCNVTKCYPKECLDLFCLSPCIALVTLFWVCGLVAIVIATCILLLLGFIAWILGWIVTILGPPIIYLGCWLGLLVVSPIAFTIVWILGFIASVLFPILCIVAVSPVGPFLAVKVPFIFVKHNLLNPAEMDASIMNALKMPLDIVKEADRVSGKVSIATCTLWHHEEPVHAEKDVEVHKEIKYWDLFFLRSIQEVAKVLKKQWLLHDDIAEASPTAMTAIPGFTILAVIIDSVQKEDKDKSLIFWHEKAQCTNTRRNHQDNVSNHFFPLLVKLKASMRACSDLSSAQAAISASLCDQMPEDEKTEHLKEYMKTNQITDAAQKKVRSELNNIVYALLRVERMQQELMKICQYDYVKMPSLSRRSSKFESDEDASLLV